MVEMHTPEEENDLETCSMKNCKNKSILVKRCEHLVLIADFNARIGNNLTDNAIGKSKLTITTTNYEHLL